MKKLLYILLSTCALHMSVAAHVLDQYLQVTQISLSPNQVRIELRLIPGIQVADQIYRVIDADGDNKISTKEEQKYAQLVLTDISLKLGEENIALTRTDIQFPTQAQIREGLGTIRLVFEGTAALSTASPQQILFRNNHYPELGVYLANAMLPATSEIQIGAQIRDPLQRELQVNYQMINPPATHLDLGISGLLLCLGVFFWAYLRLSSSSKIKKPAITRRFLNNFLNSIFGKSI